LASSPPSQPESCGCEKFFLTARDFFSDICQVGSWESTCLLYAATSTVGKEDSRPNSPADKLFLPLFFLVDQKYFLIMSTNLVDQINFYVFWLTKFILTFLEDQINFYVFWSTKLIVIFLVHQIYFLRFLVDQIHFFTFFGRPNSIFLLILVDQIQFCYVYLSTKIILTFFGPPNSCYVFGPPN
jgi:hypothetical protein